MFILNVNVSSIKLKPVSIFKLKIKLQVLYNFLHRQCNFSHVIEQRLNTIFYIPTYEMKILLYKKIASILFG